MPAFSERTKVILALSCTLVFWATAFAAIRVALESYSPMQLAFLRFLEASIIMGCLMMGKKLHLYHRKDLLYFFLAGFVGVAVYHIALNVGEQTVNAGTASFIINTAPIFTAILATTVLKEKINFLGWIGIMVSFFGVSIISFGHEGGIQIQFGALLILVSAVATAIYAVIQKLYLHRYQTVEFVTYSIWAGTLVLFVFSAGSFEAAQNASMKSTLSLLWLGAFPGAIGYLTWVYALKRMPANRLMSAMYIIPLLATFVAWVWLDEIPSQYALFGGVVVLTGLFLLHRSKKKVTV
ncbi:MAG: DMT family transporter [Deltaproteobacteria bacterium]|nr:DMT family transporter [Deltaproteobacteria bacterium]